MISGVKSSSMASGVKSASYYSSSTLQSLQTARQGSGGGGPVQKIGAVTASSGRPDRMELSANGQAYVDAIKARKLASQAINNSVAKQVESMATVNSPIEMKVSDLISQELSAMKAEQSKPVEQMPTKTTASLVEEVTSAKTGTSVRPSVNVSMMEQTSVQSVSARRMRGIAAYQQQQQFSGAVNSSTSGQQRSGSATQNLLSMTV